MSNASTSCAQMARAEVGSEEFGDGAAESGSRSRRSLLGGEDPRGIVVEDLQEVVDGEDERDLTVCGIETPPHEAAETAVLLGVAKKKTAPTV